jgi:hypothetical protein
MGDNMADNEPQVQQVSASDRDDTWQIEFTDGFIMYCAKTPPRDDAHVDALIASHGHSGIDPEQHARMTEMITAVRAHEATLAT